MDLLKPELNNQCATCGVSPSDPNYDYESLWGQKYRENNKEKIAIRKKKFRVNNKEKLAIKQKEIVQVTGGKLYFHIYTCILPTSPAV